MAKTRATMDFFAHQDAARRKTFLLTAYFLLAVFFIICGVYLALILALNMATESSEGFAVWNPTLILQVAAAVIVLILTGSLYKIIALSRGGEKVAEMLGATPVSPDSTNPDERKLLNVVEEIAIAAGMAVPRVYVLREEKGINAFAAGFSTQDAVIAVTHGCLTNLTRDELQGVVAHEFSHILNGDMRLNIRLMGIINGILVIALIGRLILRGISSSSSSRSRSSSKKGGSIGLPILIFALAVLVVGYVGVFFGKLIKSAVSRQREFLADASAVRFTRNPTGIAGALKKIGGFVSGTRVNSVHAEEASHLFFVDGLKEAFFKMLSTHPDIEERIRRIDPLFSEKITAAATAPSGPAPHTAVSSLAAGTSESASEQTKIKLPADQVLSQVGAPQQEHLAHATRWMRELPPVIPEAAREPYGARALVYCLLLDMKKPVRERQLAALKQSADAAVLKKAAAILPLVNGVAVGYRLPLLDLTLPALKSLSADQYADFRKNITTLMEADGRISLFEYALSHTVARHLDPIFFKKKPARVKYHTPDQLQVELTELLSLMAWQGNRKPALAEKAFQAAMAECFKGGKSAILPLEKCDNLKLLEPALERLAQASPQVKKKILLACVKCVSTDGWVTVEEAELIRIMADGLDCPVPLLTIGAQTGEIPMS